MKESALRAPNKKRCAIRAEPGECVSAYDTCAVCEGYHFGHGQRLARRSNCNSHHDSSASLTIANRISRLGDGNWHTLLFGSTQKDQRVV